MVCPDGLRERSIERERRGEADAEHGARGVSINIAADNEDIIAYLLDHAYQHRHWW